MFKGSHYQYDSLNNLIFSEKEQNGKIQKYRYFYTSTQQDSAQAFTNGYGWVTTGRYEHEDGNDRSYVYRSDGSFNFKIESWELKDEKGNVVKTIIEEDESITSKTEYLIEYY